MYARPNFPEGLTKLPLLSQYVGLKSSMKVFTASMAFDHMCLPTLHSVFYDATMQFDMW
jgi:hypothetical protein